MILFRSVVHVVPSAESVFWFPSGILFHRRDDSVPFSCSRCSVGGSSGTTRRAVSAVRHTLTVDVLKRKEERATFLRHGERKGAAYAPAVGRQAHRRGRRG
jgi:hypothetical protein